DLGPLPGLFVFGSVYSFVPSASSTKLRTVLGAWFGNNWIVMSPWLVFRTAYVSSAMTGSSFRSCDYPREALRAPSSHAAGFEVRRARPWLPFRILPGKRGVHRPA